MSKIKKQNKAYVLEESELTYSPDYYRMLDYMLKDCWNDPSNDDIFEDPDKK